MLEQAAQVETSCFKNPYADLTYLLHVKEKCGLCFVGQRRESIWSNLNDAHFEWEGNAGVRDGEAGMK